MAIQLNSLDILSLLKLKLMAVAALKQALLSGNSSLSLCTTIELLSSQCCHRSALQAAGIVTGGSGLSIARLSILLQQVSQPQQLTVTVQCIGIQSPEHTDKTHRHKQIMEK